MEWFNQILAEKYGYAIGWMLIHALWQVAGIGLILWLTLRISSSKSASFKYKLALTAFLLIPIISIGTFLYHLDKGNQVKSLSHIPQEVLTEAYLAGQFNPEKDAGIIPISWRSEIEAKLPTLVNIWMIGAMLFMIRLAGSLSDIRNLHRKPNELLSEDLQSYARNKSKQLGISRPLSLLKSKYIDTPITYGIFKPVILIPTSLLLQINPLQLEAIIAHELAHIKRFDYLINLLQRTAEVIFFFHPVFWWINMEIRKYREMACDDLAIAHGTRPKDLAFGLANVLNHAEKESPEMALTAAQKATPTLDRIKRIMGYQTDTTQPTTLTSITMILTLIIGATLMVSAEREPQEQDFQREKTEIETKDLDLASSDTTKNKKSIITDEGVIIRIDDSGNIAFIDTTKTKRGEKFRMDTLMAEKYQLSPEEWERIQKSIKKLEDWQMPFKDLDFDFEVFSNMPMLKLHELPMPEFEQMPKFEFDPETFPIPESFENMPRIIIPRDSTMKFYRMPTWPFEGDTAKMDKEKLEQFKKEVRENTAAFRIAIQAQNEERKAKIEEWKSEHQEELAEWKEKQKEWHEKNAAQIQEWSEKNKPLIEEYKIKVSKWKEENEPQLEEFKKEMEEWRKTHEAEMMELKKELKEMQLKLQQQKEIDN